MKKEFYYLSADEKTQIHAIEWMPEEPPRAVLQLCHGMAEYIARYDDFGEFLSLIYNRNRSAGLLSREKRK